MNHFTRVHDLVGQKRLDREQVLLPLAHQRARITELEAALKDLLRAGDTLRLRKEQQDVWHASALAAEKVLGDA